MKNKNKGETMKTITKIQLEKILISLIKKIDYRASNIKVLNAGEGISKIMVDHVYKDQPSLNELNIEWVSFGRNYDGNLFYDVDGVEGRHYFGEQDYSADLQIAWSFVQQQLYKFGVHSESYYGKDGIQEVIGDGTFLNQKDLEENVFDRKPSKSVRKAYSEAFYRDFPECREENI
jgi:hypothetical protein